MTLAFLLAAVMVMVVVAAVIPRRVPGRGPAGPGRTPRFPWFWVGFPVTVLATVSAVGVVLSRTVGVTETDHRPVDLSLTYPDFGGGGDVQFLSNEQFRSMSGPLPADVYLWGWPVLALAGVALCLWLLDSGERRTLSGSSRWATLALVVAVTAVVLGAVTVIYYMHHTPPPVPVDVPLSTPVPGYVNTLTIAGLVAATVLGISAMVLGWWALRGEETPKAAIVATWTAFFGPVVMVVAAVYGLFTTPVPY